MSTDKSIIAKSTFLYAIIIFASAFLVFQIQPIISKFILPWFGGTPSVWTVCMLFFQVVLFGGYYYAHLITSRITKPLMQILVHGSVLFLSVLLVLTHNILPGDAMKPLPGGTPETQILFILVITIGLPYFALAATSPLLQFWYSCLHHRKEPYVLYSFSNIGSLLALISYPPLVEPLLSLHKQSWIWSICYVVFAVGCGILMWYSSQPYQVPQAQDPLAAKDADSKSKKKKKRDRQGSADISSQVSHKEGTHQKNQEIPGVSLFQKICWIILPMAASMLLLAVTNQLCTDVSSGPFLWILPLSIYLITFILTFSGWRYVYQRQIFFILMVIGTIAIYNDMHYPHNNSLLLKIVIYCAMLFLGCTSAHGELYRLRPHPEQLTRYYLSISGGGALGGIFVVLIAPVIFPDYLELQVAIIAIMALVILCAYEETRQKSARTNPYVTYGIPLVLLVIMAAALANQAYQTITNLPEIRRNFFGVVRVLELNQNDPSTHQYRLKHGNTEHGMQFTNPSRSGAPTLYFSQISGVGVALTEYPHSSNIRVGVVGLGIGTIAAYAQPGDEYRFYEINPDIIALAQDTRYFTYIEHARQKGARVDILLGDARLSMEHEAATGSENVYDILILDAFSSDAIPSHLLTKEAFDLYFKLLKKDGILAVHITNRNVDLSPVILAMAMQYQYHTFFLLNKYIPEEEIYLARWILLSNNPDFVKKRYTGRIPVSNEKRLKHLWTDDFSNLWSLLK